ncbi:MAG: hypothetical protein MJZ78_04755 [Bacteroidales bacterium]|nr:hypothetical protein [Bacteroidales bacterium]
MKKTLLTIAITLGLAFGASAQSDGFFGSYSMGDGSRNENQDLPTLPQGGQTGNQDAPLGTGLLILTALGAGYAVAKKREDR